MKYWYAFTMYQRANSSNRCPYGAHFCEFFQGLTLVSEVGVRSKKSRLALDMWKNKQ